MNGMNQFPNEDQNMVEDAPAMPEMSEGMESEVETSTGEVLAEAGEEAQAVVEEAGDAVANPRFVVKRAGAESDDILLFGCPAIVGRFDPSVGPIDVDFGNLEEGVYVSRKHAKVTEEDGVYTLTDLGSSNGTYVLREGNFEKIEESVIEPGDEIAFGNARVVFYV